ncbi:MAG: GHKL domain-containing protein [Chitinispirillaceae bacterium]|nr:GHKL domain-containing protein [Chitinispirillaceae bacterium]
MKECAAEIDSVVRENESLKGMVHHLKETQGQLLRSEKLASIGRLSAGIAHEINNPVGFVSSNSTTLLGYVDRIKEILKMYRTGIKKDLIDKREKQLKIDFILEDIDQLLMENIEGLARITTIVNNLKKFSRDQQSGELISADINEGIRSVLILVKNESKYYADIITDFGDIGQIPCTISELNQVFLNIIMNAVQAIKEQGRGEKGLITVKTWRDDAWVYIAIADDGPGIPQEIQDKIFNPFFTTKPAGTGTGLGLSICYEIVVDKHGGDIQVASRTGAGTTFTIKLPRIREDLNG